MSPSSPIRLPFCSRVDRGQLNSGGDNSNSRVIEKVKLYTSKTTCMVSDRQVKRLWRLAQKLSVEAAAAKSGMDSKTARKYLRDRRPPSEMREKHTWRPRPDPFADQWEEIRQLLMAEPELQPKTLFEH